uniref:NB-ARC domain, putative n=2 Tax=Oryza sativa subsp. japonica TaxID=39947 RepID=Q2R890_ORYSJ|nr:NB-ARC domain, putative [Oryza sativa Japonica Group]ABA92260.1 NB-ARC domain containing protein [Oryza sativa Japonica Group]
MGGVVEQIVVSALTGAMSPLLRKLTNLIEKKYMEVKGVRKKLEQLTKELMTIGIALEKYAAMDSPDVQVKAWMAEMRELAYDMEDSIDLFTYRIDHEPADTTNGVKRVLHKTLRKVKKFHHRHKFAKEIEELHVLVNEAYERQKRYRIEEGTSSKLCREIDPRLPALYVEKEKLVGIQGPMKEIINWFGSEEVEPIGQRKIVSIVGQGGLGKTTLANQVYQKIKGQFSFSAFVSVSQKPNMDNLLRELLSQIKSNEPTESYSDQQLIDKLRTCLKDERYLIVIDDIWKRSAWKTIQCAFPINKHASRIITTTRIKSVAQSCCGASDEGFVYQMKPLNKSDSENLFLTRTFGAEKKCPSQLEGIISDILYKCDGLPLAIITIASLLADKPRTREEWERVLNYIVSTSEKDNDLEVMNKILFMSYNDLPHHMKSCLLHLGLFHLRYLGLRWSRIDCLPVQIGKLEYLQTLDLRHTSLLVMPESIVQLKRLMRLVGHHLILPDGFGNMESLQELGFLGCCRSSTNLLKFQKDLQLLRNLRVLKVRFLSEGETGKEAMIPSLCKLGGNNLREVYITSCNGSGDCFADSWCPSPCFLEKFVYKSSCNIHYFSRFPKWIHPTLSRCLTYLDIDVKQMEREHVRILEDLPALIVLHLDIGEALVYGIRISHGAFQCLARLRFCNRSGPGLVFKGGMPKLEWLSVEFGAERAQSTYGSLEVGIRHITSLKHIDFSILVLTDDMEWKIKSSINSQVKMLPQRPEVNIKTVLLPSIK